MILKMKFVICLLLSILVALQTKMDNLQGIGLANSLKNVEIRSFFQKYIIYFLLWNILLQGSDTGSNVQQSGTINIIDKNEKYLKSTQGHNFQQKKSSSLSLPYYSSWFHQR